MDPDVRQNWKGLAHRVMITLMDFESNKGIELQSLPINEYAADQVYYAISPYLHILHDLSKVAENSPERYIGPEMCERLAKSKETLQTFRDLFWELTRLHGSEAWPYLEEQKPSVQDQTSESLVQTQEELEESTDKDTSDVQALLHKLKPLLDEVKERGWMKVSSERSAELSARVLELSRRAIEMLGKPDANDASTMLEESAAPFISSVNPTSSAPGSTDVAADPTTSTSTAAATTLPTSSAKAKNDDIILLTNHWDRLMHKTKVFTRKSGIPLPPSQGPKNAEYPAQSATPEQRMLWYIVYSLRVIEPTSARCRGRYGQRVQGNTGEEGS